jgi:hypothetical protein
MHQAFANRALFVITYAIFLLPTYFLSYAGIAENGWSLQAISFSSLLYVLSMIAILAICYARGVLIGKNWLVLIPAVAFTFNLTPTLTTIPFVPFVYHLLAISLGAVLPLLTQHETFNVATDTSPQC